MKINVLVQSDNDIWLNNIYENIPVEGDSVAIDEHIDIELTSKDSSGKGFGTVDLIAGIAIGIGSGIPAGIIANVLYDKLMNKGRNQLIFKETKQIITTKDEILEYVETYILKSE